MRLSVITINYNTEKQTLETLKNFQAKYSGSDYEIILIDNNSKSFDSKIFSEIGIKKIIENESNRGFAPAVNQGLDIAEGEDVLLLNSDLLISEGSIEKMLNYLEANKEVGIVGPKMTYLDGSYQISSGNFPTFAREFLRITSLFRFFGGSTFNKSINENDLEPRMVDWLSGGCFLIKGELMKKIGKLDSNYYFGVEDIDYCYRALKAGYKTAYLQEVAMLHYLGFSSKGGTRSMFRLIHDRNGFLYFFRKTRLNKIKYLILFLLYNLKIFTIHMLNKTKKNKYKAVDATIAITHKCNARCGMCNIWKEENPKNISKDLFEKLSPDLKYINLSGGEPFLNPEIVEICETIKRVSPKAQIIISTNGLSSDLIIETMKKIMLVHDDVGLRVSIDGGKETHNKIRGLLIYDQALQTIEGLKKIGLKNLGISFTIQDGNIDELLEAYNFAENNDLQFALALVQNSEIYFQKDSNKISNAGKVEVELMKIIRKELRSWNPKRWLRAYYDFGLLYNAKYKKRLLPSGAGFDSLFIDADASVYPSNLINLKMGNLKDNSLVDIWGSPKANDVRNDIISKKIEESWIICTIRGEIKRNAHKVLFWVFINKLKNLV